MISLYVNSRWEHQKNPYSGDVINSYNDGPINGDILGPFYELESSSPALSLNPLESYTHKQMTIHLSGSFNSLNSLSKKTLLVDLNEIE